MKGRELINFIIENHLEDIEMEPEWVGEMCWSVFLDDEHKFEIDYSFKYKTKERNTVYYYDWTNYDPDSVDDTPRVEITFEEALRLRGLA